MNKTFNRANIIEAAKRMAKDNYKVLNYIEEIQLYSEYGEPGYTTPECGVDEKKMDNYWIVKWARGDCGHHHCTLENARKCFRKCLTKYRIAGKKQGEYSDIDVYLVQDGKCTIVRTNLIALKDFVDQSKKESIT